MTLLEFLRKTNDEGEIVLDLKQKHKELGTLHQTKKIFKGN